jgi:vanillate O-demethylase ferredoxin subunit
VLNGEPDHRDAILTAAERERNDKMCVCVGRAMGERLVIDA